MSAAAINPNRRLAWILASFAVLLFVGFIVKSALFGI